MSAKRLIEREKPLWRRAAIVVRQGQVFAPRPRGGRVARRAWASMARLHEHDLHLTGESRHDVMWRETAAVIRHDDLVLVLWKRLARERVEALLECRWSSVRGHDDG